MCQQFGENTLCECIIYFDSMHVHQGRFNVYLRCFHNYFGLLAGFEYRIKTLLDIALLEL